MIDNIKNIISKSGNQYTDVRYEEVNRTEISFSGGELSSQATNFSDGFCLRVLNKGGLAVGTFNRIEDAGGVLESVSRATGLMSENSQRIVDFEKVPVVNDVVKITPEIDPRGKSLDEKIRLLSHYNSIPMGQKQIQTTKLHYREIYRRKYFVNTEGTTIDQEILTVNILGGIFSKDGNLIQDIRVSVGGAGDYKYLLNRENVFEEKTKLCVDLLRASPTPGGNYTVLLDQNIGGVFVHEAFGHFCEADIIEDNPSLRKVMTLNTPIGGENLTIIDDATIPDALSYYKYDDEGVAGSKTYLMRNGVLTGRLHSRRTAHSFDEFVTGNAVAEDYRYEPIIRMSNIYVRPCEHSFQELLENVGNGFYICGGKGGQTMGDVFSFGAQYGYMVRSGKIGEMVRDVNMSGNLFNTLKSIRMIGNDLKLSEAGGCGKGQLNIKTCYGTPHLLIDGVTIGGK